MMKRSSSRTRPATALGHTRVLLMGPDAREFGGGIRTFVETLPQAFNAASSPQFEQFAVTLGFYDRESWLSKLSRSARLLPRFYRRVWNFDVVHLNSTFDHRSVLRDCVYLIAARLRGPRVILQFHGGDPRNVIFFRLPGLRRLLSYLLRQCDFVLVLSREQMNRLAQLMPDVHNMRLVSNYIPIEDITAKRSEADRPLRFLFLSRLHVAKGVREIMAAAKYLAQERQPFEIHFCGDGPERGWLLDNMDGNCRLTYRGAVRGLEKRQELMQADVMLLPSKHEAFPFVLLEAMAFGLPTIACPVGAIPDVLIDGVNGLLVPVGSIEALIVAMRNCIVDRGMVQAMSIASRALAEQKYSLASMRCAFGPLYEVAAGLDVPTTART